MAHAEVGAHAQGVPKDEAAPSDITNTTTRNPKPATKPQSRKRARPRPEVCLLGWFPELYSRRINI